jgi:hypothetical protein
VPHVHLFNSTELRTVLDDEVIEQFSGPPRSRAATTAKRAAAEKKNEPKRHCRIPVATEQGTLDAIVPRPQDDGATSERS